MKTFFHIVWLMGLIYKLFFATPCKHPHILTILHINTKYGDVCTPLQFELF